MSEYNIESHKSIIEFIVTFVIMHVFNREF